MENKKCSDVNLAYSSLDELLLSIYSTVNINANISCGNFDNSTKSLNNKQKALAKVILYIFLWKMNFLIILIDVNNLC